MTDIDTALLDAALQTIIDDAPIMRNFSHSCSVLELGPEKTSERAAQIRVLQRKFELLSRPARRLQICKLIQKLLSDEMKVKK